MGPWPALRWSRALRRQSSVACHATPAGKQQQAADAAAYQQEQQEAQMQAMAQQAAAQQAAAQAAAAPPPPAAPAATDITAQLQQLAALKEQGVLSDEEFAAAKAKLLGG